MATCNPQTLMTDAGCLACLGQKELSVVAVALLCKILQAEDAMAECDPQQLVTDSACLLCLGEKELMAIQVQLLCEILEALET